MISSPKPSTSIGSDSNGEPTAMRSGFGNTEGHLFQALTSGQYNMTADNINGTSLDKDRQTPEYSQKNQAASDNNAHNESTVTVEENGIQKSHATASTEENDSPGNTETPKSPEVPTIARKNKVLRRSSLQNTTVASYMVSDLYRCRTIRRLLDQSSLLQEAQVTLLQEMPTFRPDDFGLDARHHYGSSASSSCYSNHGNEGTGLQLPWDAGMNYYYSVAGKANGGKNVDRDKRMAQVIGQSSAYFTIYGVDFFAELLYQPEGLRDSSSQPASMKTKPYVLKKVNHYLLTPEAMAEKPKAIPQAAITLAMEAHFLAASCSHPHIVNLRGMADPKLTPMGQMFFVVDRLEETLNQRIGRRWKLKWQQQQRRNSSTHSIVSMLTPTSSTAKKSKAQDHLMQELQFQLERYTAARDLASAIGHLHKHRILHRDIKPENVGFAFGKEDPEVTEANREKGKKDSYRPNGLIQLFDFGIATELPPPFDEAAVEKTRNEPYNKDEAFQLTQRVGSIRYMAPEVYLGRKYGASSDVYSLGVVLFEMFSLQTPFDDMSERCMQTLVFERGMRPMDIPSYWNEKLSFLVTTAWSQALRYRPSAVNITTRFDHLCQEVQQKMLQVTAPCPEEPSGSAGGPRHQRRSSLTGAMKQMMPRRMSIGKIKRRASISGTEKSVQKKDSSGGERAAAGRESLETKDCDNTSKGKRRLSLKKRGSDASSHGEKAERHEKHGSGSSPGDSDKPARRVSIERKFVQAASSMMPSIKKKSTGDLRSTDPQSPKNQRPFGRRSTMDHNAGSGGNKDAEFTTRTLKPIPPGTPSFTHIMQTHQFNQIADHIEHHKGQEPQSQQPDPDRQFTPTRRRNSMTKYSAVLAAEAAAEVEAEEVATAAAAASFGSNIQSLRSPSAPALLQSHISNAKGPSLAVDVAKGRQGALISETEIGVKSNPVSSKAAPQDLKHYEETKGPKSRSKASKMFRRSSL